MITLRNPRADAHEVDREAIQLRDDVLAIVAHDLRSPISTILMAADLLHHKHSADNSTSRFLEMITNAAHQADSLVRDLLDVTRIEAGHFAVEPKNEQLECILTSIAAMYTQQAAKAGILLGCNFAGVEGITVVVDYPRFAQLLSNLIENAIKFTPAGGSIWLSAVPDDGVVTISVRDSGIGISKDELPHVFERFWQANTHHRAGAGLGLAIAKGIAEAHGGEIGAMSTEGCGSTFFFTLPIAAQS